MSKFNKDEWSSKLIDKIEKRESRKSNSYENNERLEDVLKVPLIGGMWYIIRKLNQANHMNKILKNEYSNKLRLKDQIKNENLIKESIRVQINKALLVDTIKKFTVPEKYMNEFLTVKDEFPHVTFIHNGENKFTIITSDDDILF